MKPLAPLTLLVTAPLLVQKCLSGLRLLKPMCPSRPLGVATTGAAAAHFRVWGFSV